MTGLISFIRQSWVTPFALLVLVISGCGGPANNCSFAFSNWKGQLVTEAVNVTLELQIRSLASGDGGEWRFIGAGGQVLNQGDLQAWQNGNMVQVIIFQKGSQTGSALSGGFIDGCNRVKGSYIVNVGAGGNFDIKRQ